ncbi:MAG: hypothetical protein KUG75_04250, partial [Pseudomonadales bacterium]|nr:hypothetical protein [Pseudomonadales bacterium]
MNKQFPKKQSRLSPAQTFRRCSTLILSLILTTFLAGNVSAAESTADTKAPGAECTHGSKQKNLSPEQLKARGDTHFKKVDTDNDGSITPAELSQAKLPHSGHHRSRHAKHRLFAKSHGKAGKKELGSSDK